MAGSSVSTINGGRMAVPTNTRTRRLALLYASAQIDRRVRELAEQIRGDHPGGGLLVLGVLKGAFMFLADLVRHLDMDAQIDFVAVSSYGLGTQSSGAPVIEMPPSVRVEGRDVLVVEDILDTGLSMAALFEHLRARSPRSLRLCVLIDKRARREAPIAGDYVGFELSEGFVVGYGIDYAGRYRQLRDIFTLEFDAASDETSVASPDRG